ncbi:MAG TPA: NAD(P)/FAD-dependent oxidoreductase [Candidatus Nitrosotalea sp.]|nr:NAD(P)/FAD-dependent oxidoreductase [Candidatus Nitrosotalea sp.]
MEKYDVAIIGGGSAGLAALKQLSNLGKQAILFEAGSKVGSKNISGGILYSKKPKKGKTYNVEDIYENFLTDAPFERKITKYILHATSKDKVFSIDLTEAHNYEANFGCSVLMNKLNQWFLQQVTETAQKHGGGIVPGVHVRDIRWEGERTIVQTDELEEVEVKAIIAADGVNSEVAYMTGARQKFSPSQLYQGVKVVIKLPEEIMNERFSIGQDDGAAHLFAGDVTLNHIGGGFLYTNRDTLSVGAVYHLDSLLDAPVEPYDLVNTLLKNPMISEFIKDEVPVRGEIDKNMAKEEQMRIRFAVTKMIKTWTELRDAYYSKSQKERLVKEGKYGSEDEIGSQLSSIREQMSSKYGIKFETDYVEAEYSAKLVPDGKRCRMEKPYFKNILFVGDAAGRGVFVGPRIEGLNVGIDDAARAANAVARSLDKNNFSDDYLGQYYSQSVEESPYTHDLKSIDKDYLKIFLDAAKDVPKDIISAKYGMVVKMMSSRTLRNFAVGFANILGYEKLLPVIETTETYVKVPTEIAERLGKSIQSSYTPSIPPIAQRVAKLKYNDDNISHIKVLKPTSEFMKKMITLCPTGCYFMEKDGVMIQHEGCVECGTCSEETDWKHPRGEKGINYQYG